MDSSFGVHGGRVKCGPLIRPVDRKCAPCPRNFAPAPREASLEICAHSGVTLLRLKQAILNALIGCQLLYMTRDITQGIQHYDPPIAGLTECRIEDLELFGNLKPAIGGLHPITRAGLQI